MVDVPRDETTCDTIQWAWFLYEWGMGLMNFHPLSQKSLSSSTFHLSSWILIMDENDNEENWLIVKNVILQFYE